MKPTRQTSLNDWIDWLLALHACEIDLGLARVRHVGERLQVLKPCSQVVTVSGTNGKGSSIEMLNAIYQAAGYRVGCYTSPHLLHFNERIQLNGLPVSDQLIVDAFDKIEHARQDTKLTYFEFSTLAALVIFNQSNLDVVLLEVGLGGRLDAVNIVDANLALVTSISIDHVDWLGSDLQQIALEKAGIMRSHVPAVCSDPNVPTRLIDYAETHSVPLKLAQKSYIFRQNDLAWLFSMDGRSIKLNNPNLLGHFQVQNAAGVVACVETLQGVLPVSDMNLNLGLVQIKHLGRLEHRTVGHQAWLLDVAHNPQSAEALAQFLQSESLIIDVAIFSVLVDKDILPMLTSLVPYIKQWHIADLAVARSTSRSRLREQLLLAGVDGDNVYDADSIACAVNTVKDKEVGQVLACGSFFTVSQVMEALSNG